MRAARCGAGREQGEKMWVSFGHVEIEMLLEHLNKDARGKNRAD